MLAQMRLSYVENCYSMAEIAIHFFFPFYKKAIFIIKCAEAKNKIKSIFFRAVENEQKYMNIQFVHSDNEAHL